MRHSESDVRASSLNAVSETPGNKVNATLYCACGMNKPVRNGLCQGSHSLPQCGATGLASGGAIKERVGWSLWRSILRNGGFPQLSCWYWGLAFSSQVCANTECLCLSHRRHQRMRPRLLRSPLRLQNRRAASLFARAGYGVPFLSVPERKLISALSQPNSR